MTGQAGQIMTRLRHFSPRLLELALLVFAITLPYMEFMNRTRMSIAVLAGVYIMLGLSLNVIVGYAGLFQLGHAAFFGLGAYTAAILSIDHHVTMLATIPVAALVAGFAALLITKPILHLRGDYLCIVTIAFGEIFRISVTNNLFGITGGSNGLFGAGRPEFPLPWESPTPIIMLVIILALYLLMTYRDKLVLSLGGAAIIAAGYYGPLVLLDHKELSVISIFMGFAAVIGVALARSFHVGPRGQFAALLVIVGAFVVWMAARSDELVASILWNLDEYFRIGDPGKVFGVEFTPVAFRRDARPYYFLVLIFIVLTVIGMRRLQNSRLGRAWLYVREDQLAAEAMGIDTTQIKTVAFVIGSAWAGVAGVLYASRFTVVAPENFNFLQSVIMFCIVVLGGSGSIPGVLVGTLGMVVLPELLRDVGPTFLYEGNGPIIMLIVILGSYLYNAQSRLRPALIESGAIAAAFFLPTLVLDEPPLYVVGLLMALITLILAAVARRRTINAQPWVLGGLAVYVVVLLIVGGSLGPDIARETAKFQIMDWRDGLMGTAMVLMMILRPAGMIPEKRRGVVMAEESESAPTAALGQTV
jgi:branched-chain amino acid transport system permease protein